MGACRLEQNSAQSNTFRRIQIRSWHNSTRRSSTSHRERGGEEEEEEEGGPPKVPDAYEFRLLLAQEFGEHDSNGP